MRPSSFLIAVSRSRSRTQDDTEIGPDRALRWITINAARALGIDGFTGSLEEGKNADVVWNGNPFSVYAKAEQVLLVERRTVAYQCAVW